MKTMHRLIANNMIKAKPEKYQVKKIFLWFPSIIDGKLKWLTHIDTLQHLASEQDTSGNWWYAWYNVAYIKDFDNE